MKNGKVVDRDGTEFWYENGLLHREDGPAVIYSNGHKFWYKNGKLHREDGPAIVAWNGSKQWWMNGGYFFTKEEWWDALTPDQKEKALFNGEGL